MSTTVLDQTQDLTGEQRHRLTQLYQAPEFVKTADHHAVCGESENLENHVYAHPVKRLYPCHTKAATWMSALFFADNKNQLSDEEAKQVQENLLKTASYWLIRKDVEELWDKMAQDESKAYGRLTDTDFALVFESAGIKHRHYPLRNAAEITKAAQWFTENHRDFVFADKNTVATKILTKAAECNAEIDNIEFLNRCAGFGYCASEDIAKAWDKRAMLVRSRHPDYAEQATNIAQSMRSQPLHFHDNSIRVKVATVMDGFDRQTQLHTMYDDGGLERPEDVLFQITEKVASDFLNQHVQTTTGAIYEKQSLGRLDIDHVRSWLGNDLADECGGVMLDVEKLAEVLPTLPKPDAEMFEQMAKAAGVGVIAREKLASAGISEDELNQFAAEYLQK